MNFLVSWWLQEMKLFQFNLLTSCNRWLFNVAVTSAALWLSIVFFVGKISLYYHWNLFLLGILPDFFAGISLYLFLFLKGKSLVKSALWSFSMLTLAEIVQLFTPRTFDPLDLLAAAIGIGCGEAIRRGIELKFKN